jgi:hypothetical protein
MDAQALVSRRVTNNEAWVGLPAVFEEAELGSGLSRGDEKALQV